MRVLVVGNGGREHALLWKLKRDDAGLDLYVTQPNGGMAGLATAVPIAATDTVALAGWAAARQIDLAVIGPEGPLAAGLVDRLALSGVPAFGPTAAAARIESSKAYAKALMKGAGVPTADYARFTEVEAALAHVRERGAPIVVKASGLAAGKGAVVCDRLSAAEEAVREMLEALHFGEAGREVVIEEFMEGEELSIFALTDGENCALLSPSQDHKRIGEGDTGPNTGGMGAYAPVSLATDELLGDVLDRILQPTLRALADDGSPFRGLLYAGLMITDDGPRVVEFNCRFGDPETQAVLPLMAHALLPLLDEVANGGRVPNVSLAVDDQAAVTTVLASSGYPGPYPKGVAIELPEDPGPDAVIFHAGTARDADGALVTSGGRVIAVTGLGSSLSEARARSLQVADRIVFDGKQVRRDIGWRELARDEAHRP